MVIGSDLTAPPRTMSTVPRVGAKSTAPGPARPVSKNVSGPAAARSGPPGSSVARGGSLSSSTATSAGVTPVNTTTGVVSRPKPKSKTMTSSKDGLTASSSTVSGVKPKTPGTATSQVISKDPRAKPTTGTVSAQMKGAVGAAAKEETSDPLQKAAKQKWCYERVNELNKRRDQLKMRIEQRAEELRDITAKVAAESGQTTHNSSQQAATKQTMDTQTSSGVEPQYVEQVGSDHSVNNANSSSTQPPSLFAPPERAPRERLRILTRERAARRAEFDKCTAETAKFEAETRELERDCANLARSLEKWSSNEETSRSSTKEYLAKKRELEAGKDIDSQRRQSLEAGLSDGIAVRERLKMEVAQEREKLKLLESAWVEKEASMRLEKMRTQKQLDVVSQEERALASQTEIVLAQLDAFRLQGDYRRTKERFRQMEELAAVRLQEKNGMFEQLRNLQEVHQTKKAEYEQYERKVASLQREVLEKQSDWRLQHLKTLDERICNRRKLLGGDRTYVPVRTGVSMTLNTMEQVSQV
ncbi:unnamed protein product [Amoebophrya sp. A25]|nr:unnamed protein product [Amoebophrya sp. A25]|eukprot:GSA25T00024693001.1